MKRSLIFIIVLILGCSGKDYKADMPWDNGRVIVSENGRFLQHENGKPFFWLADTGWLLFKKLNREEAERYLENRRQKGFNVIQVMVLHSIPEVNVFGDSALVAEDASRPKETPGNDPEDPDQYDFWDHVDYIVQTAKSKGIYIAMVATWGSNVKSGKITIDNVEPYAEWLANRYKADPNIFWLNGGDIRGDVEPEVWNALGNTLNRVDPNHLITFHPFGRTQSSTWFHDKEWLDFNMFQSGHRRYDQRGDEENWKGEDNWRYVQEDYNLTPIKPTVDGEPSYENIPQGLHDPQEPYWEAQDVRRYAYWSVFAGSFGHTYGNNAVMQMFKPGQERGSYGVRNYWFEAIDDPGAGQMQFIKYLMLSRPYFERIPDQSLIAGEQGDQYDYLIATRGKSYAFIYTYTGREFHVDMSKISGKKIKAWWYDPRTGQSTFVGVFENENMTHFDPPGQPVAGNDWVLVLDDHSKNYDAPEL